MWIFKKVFSNFRKLQQRTAAQLHFRCQCYALKCFELSVIVHGLILHVQACWHQLRLQVPSNYEVARKHHCPLEASVTDGTMKHGNAYKVRIIWRGFLHSIRACSLQCTCTRCWHVQGARGPSVGILASETDQYSPLEMHNSLSPLEMHSAL